ncbi:MAG TPA: phenylalanine--tRNA ligase subunit beta [Saprospiraceae bacterium]|nr:phenylalanine--tRNA ligase subunit beta [Saprospiraceae bacterium]HMP26231.1 phenylalanine--tRNA ligase subunit beta [Saprospiraceae bacterium]
MKISLNWLKQYLDIKVSPEQLGEILTDIGLELEGMEQVESVRGGLAGVVVGQVMECGQHPNADKLSLTKVAIGNGEWLSIVCGAPNVAAGQKVLVATVGTTLYPLGSEEPLTLKETKIRGELSQGMICAEDELGLGEDHAGILVLPADVPIGTPAKDYFHIETDTIYEIGLTPNRSDATNHIGVAKDLAAALRINYDHTGKVQLPSIEAFKVESQELALEVVVENQEACPRYAGLCIQGIKVADSPDWLKNRLQLIGIRPINNIVDITNFVLHELGQPLHAFDWDVITGKKVIVRTLAEGTKFTTLDEVERSLSAEDLMICDGASAPMCIGGVFGGARSGVQDSTTRIFLESAHFHPKWIRRSKTRHGLFHSEAAKIFEKGSDPNIVIYALKRAALLIQEIAGGTIASDIVDLYPQPIAKKEVEVAYDHVNRLIGADIPKPKVQTILAALEMNLVAETDTTFTVAVPTNKADVTRPADVIEEILRIYGFNNVPAPAKVSITAAAAPQPDPSALRNLIGNYLTANGFYEMMAMSITESRYYKDILTGFPAEELVYIHNTSNPTQDIMRPTMLFSGLEAIVRNQNRQQQHLKLYEFGRTYRQNNGKYREQSHLSIFLTGARYPENWLWPAAKNADFYTLKTFVQNVLARLGATQYQETTFKDDIFGYAVRYHRGEQVLAELGRVAPRMTKAMDVRGSVFYADLRWDNLLKITAKHSISFEELNKFPTVRRDLALVIDNSVKFADIAQIAKKIGKNIIKDVNLFDVYENEQQLGTGKRSYAVSFTLEDATKTLQDKEVDKIMAQLIREYETKLGATIRR